MKGVETFNLEACLPHDRCDEGPVIDRPFSECHRAGLVNFVINSGELTQSLLRWRANRPWEELKFEFFVRLRAAFN